MLVKKAMLLTMFVTMSKQLVEILQTKEGKMKEERKMKPFVKPRRPLLLMMTLMKRLLLGLKCTERRRRRR